MKTLYQSVNDVLKRLDDYPSGSGQQVWTRSEIELHIQDGYARFCRDTKCIFDMHYPENLPQAGNYVSPWEREQMLSGMISIGQVNYSGGYWERDYAQASDRGPVNSTQPWEGSYLDTIFAVGRHDLPAENVSVDRVLHDLSDLEGEWTRWFEVEDRDFETTKGKPSRYSLDKYGIGGLRLVPAGEGSATVASLHASSRTWGLLRSAGDDEGLGATWGPLGTWGVLREIPEHFPIGGQYGIPRRVYFDTDNTRVEYFRQGKDLDEYEFELPDRFVKYAEFFACAKALERDGPGQDLKLAAHFMERFNEGVQRMTKRLAECKRARQAQVGSTGKMATRPALARLPYTYGRQIRRGY